MREVLDSMEDTKGLSFEIVDWWDRPKFFNKESTKEGLEFEFQVNIFKRYTCIALLLYFLFGACSCLHVRIKINHSAGCRSMLREHDIK